MSAKNAASEMLYDEDGNNIPENIESLTNS